MSAPDYMVDIGKFLRDSGCKLALVYTNQTYLAIVSQAGLAVGTCENVDLREAVAGAIQDSRKILSESSN